MSTTEVGRRAEQAAAEFLQQKGYKIIDRNWRTRWCEIDLVAQKDETVQLVEVKYRKSDAWGTGFDYITAKKLQQMQFAAEFWVATHRWRGEISLGAIEVSGVAFAVTDWLESLE